jgi:hypothetical protein
VAGSFGSAIVLTLGGAARDESIKSITLDSTAKLVGRIIRSARRQRDPGDPFLLYVYSRYLGAYTDSFDSHHYPTRWEDPQTLALLGRYRILFAIDPHEGADAQHALTLDPGGELREGLRAVSDRDLDRMMKFGPPTDCTTLSLAPLKEDLTSLNTLSLTLARIVNAGERSLGKLPPAEWPSVSPIDGGKHIQEVITKLAGGEDVLGLVVDRLSLVVDDWLAVDTLRRLRSTQPPTVQEDIDLVVEQIAARFAKSCSVVVYIKSQAMMEEIKKATGPTTRTTR